MKMVNFPVCQGGFTHCICKAHFIFALALNKLTAFWGKKNKKKQKTNLSITNEKKKMDPWDPGL